MLSIEMLQAAHGDCLWIEYGDAAAPRRVLIDGGPSHTYGQLVDRIRALDLDDRHFELLVVTHIDTDHIDGIVRLLQEEHLGATFGEIWFNGFPQLNPAHLGPKQGEYLASVIMDLEDATQTTLWNTRFGGRAVRPDVDNSRSTLDGGLTITVLGPTVERLERLRAGWQDVLEEVGWTPGERNEAKQRLADIKTLRPVLASADDAILIEPPPADYDDIPTMGSGKPGGDTSIANGSSISLLVELGETRALLVGDAFAGDLTEAIGELVTDGGRLAVDVFKLPHHGSISNLTAGLLDVLSCRHYLVSTSGDRFKHPDGAAIDLLLDHHDTGRGDAELHFNYLTETTEEWHGGGAGFIAHHESGPLVLG